MDNRKASEHALGFSVSAALQILMYVAALFLVPIIAKENPRIITYNQFAFTILMLLGLFLAGYAVHSILSFYLKTNTVADDDNKFCCLYVFFTFITQALTLTVWLFALTLIPPLGMINIIFILSNLLVGYIFLRKCFVAEGVQKELELENHNPFTEMVEKVEALLPTHEENGTQIVEPLREIVSALNHLSLQSPLNSRVKRMVVSEKISDKLDKICYIVGEKYYLSIIDENSPWTNREEKIDDVHEAVDSFKTQLNEHILDFNKETSESVKEKMRNMSEALT